MDRNLALEFVRVTEAAAIAAASWVGRGDKNAADQAAVDEMRARFNQIEFSGRIVIGEGALDEAPELYVGEKVGTGQGPEIDLAVDPLEATDSVAHGRPNAISVIAAGPKGSLLSVPEMYMEKIAAGPRAAKAIDLNISIELNLKKVAAALGKKAQELTVVMLDRDRHQDLIAEIRKAGAKVKLITDGDVAGGIAPALPDSGIDLLMGTGKSTEAVLAAVGLKILGGEILARFKPKDQKQQGALEKMGFKDPGKIFTSEDLARGAMLTFTATGVIDGPLLSGVKFMDHKIVTHSVVMRANSGTIRYITTHHHAQQK
ncbi:MAG: class II fructose-bisphosphatase [Candidatus Doudnabacteria bacterium]|nr:class II fructose-bisphosphatase [Candidatus Doudnabacteria bacterium]